MSEAIEARRGSTKLSAEGEAELGAITDRVRERLRRTASDVLAIGADLVRAKALLGHGRFGPWLDDEFSLSRRSAEQFMAATRRFGLSACKGAPPANPLAELFVSGSATHPPWIREGRRRTRCRHWSPRTPLRRPRPGRRTRCSRWRSSRARLQWRRSARTHCRHKSRRTPPR